MSNIALVYRDVTQLAYELMDRVDNLPKKYKYVLGDRIISKSIDCIQSIVLYHKNKKDEKYERMFFNDYQQLRVLIRILEEKKLLSIGQISHIALIINRIETNLK